MNLAAMERIPSRLLLFSLPGDFRPCISRTWKGPPPASFSFHGREIFVHESRGHEKDPLPALCGCGKPLALWCFAPSPHDKASKMTDKQRQDLDSLNQSPESWHRGLPPGQGTRSKDFVARGRFTSKVSKPSGTLANERKALLTSHQSSTSSIFNFSTLNVDYLHSRHSLALQPPS
ncbi:hypothetical protein LZ31DRAFT_559168 [Colletotrichum somersetense]|nr:hypothetical protein LZ31DRAFT_559168 [Colletotrichum somersetense]